MVSVTVPIWLSFIRTAFRCIFLDTPRDIAGIGHEDIITHDLDSIPLLSCLLLESLPIIFSQTILYGYEMIFVRSSFT